MKKIFSSLFLLLSLTFLISSCEKEEEDVQPNSDPLLHVEFTNDATSEFTITQVQMISHGNAGETDEGPIGNWSGNIIPNGNQLSPGEMVVMDLAIENSYKYVYRLAVLDENGTEVWLHEQEGFNDDAGGTITHWGSHNRQVYVSVVRNTSTGFIYIQGWGDNAY
jgi:hypothetical protein